MIRVLTDDPRILLLADRLWDRATRGAATLRLVPAPVSLAIEVSATDPAAGVPLHLDERWRVDTDDAELSLGDQHLHARIECGRGRFVARVSAALVSDHPDLVTRLLLEAPAATLLARRSYAVVHAGAVAGPAGAVVIRGAPGAGKSTVVAAAHQAGLRVLGDESMLVSRSDPDDLLSAVRDLTLLPAAARLLGLEAMTTATRSGGEEKRRVDLFSSSSPMTRRARRVATVLLGPRNDGPARLEPLTPETFLEEFRLGAIAQESWSGTPEHIAVHWSRRRAYRLSGAADLAGAIDLLTGLVAPLLAVKRA
ncbi:MAG TPA: hypothetical protein VLV16_00240 [Gemmatimonadales bacterium]|nr:hypothetical protein [Gemmatimonadales bacterium]